MRSMVEGIDDTNLAQSDSYIYTPSSIDISMSKIYTLSISYILYPLLYMYKSGGAGCSQLREKCLQSHRNPLDLLRIK